jgi:hypothetical protein
VIRSGRIWWLAALVIAGSTTVQAQEMGFLGWGFRAGVSIDPDQAFAGVHFDLGEPVKNMRIMPELEVGVGDDQTLVALGCEVRWEFITVRWGGWMPYVGAEGAFHYAKLDDELGRGRRNFDDDDTDVQISAIGGIQSELKGGNRWFIQGKVGLLEDPDFKAAVGFTF